MKAAPRNCLRSLCEPRENRGSRRRASCDHRIGGSVNGPACPPSRSALRTATSRSLEPSTRLIAPVPPAISCRGPCAQRDHRGRAPPAAWLAKRSKSAFQARDRRADPPGSTAWGAPGKFASVYSEPPLLIRFSPSPPGSGPEEIVSPNSDVLKAAWPSV